MYYELVFCSDGTLRAKFNDDKRLVSLSGIQKILKQNDNEFWQGNIKKYTHFEKGLTVHYFLKSIMPWCEYFSKLKNVDIKDYYNETIKLTDSNEKEFDYIMVFKNINVSPEIEYEEKLESFEDIQEWFNTKKKRRLTGKWTIENILGISGYIYDKEEHYSVDHVNFSKIKNCPIYLNTNQNVLVSLHEQKKPNNIDQNLHGSLILNDSLILSGNTEFRLSEILEAFFDWLPYNTKERDDFVNHLIEIKESIDSSESIATENEDIIKEKKIVISDGAFDGLIEEAENDHNNWEWIVSKVTEDKQELLRLGANIQEEIPENRIQNLIIKETITPTEYKY